MSSHDQAQPSVDRVLSDETGGSRVVMYQGWSHLLFVHWPIAPGELEPFLPPGLQVDTFKGRAYVGLVPFTMVGVRPRGLPAVRWLSDFHEVNVRTYVHAEGRDPGVWFFSLDAANGLAVRLARRWFHLPYHHATMSLDVSDEGMGQGAVTEVGYRSDRRPGWPPPASCKIQYRVRGEPAPAAPGTLEHFLVERYLLYASDRDALYRGRVRHAPYRIQTAELISLEESLIAAAGLRPEPVAPLVHYSPGVRVEVSPLERLR